MTKQDLEDKTNKSNWLHQIKQSITFHQDNQYHDSHDSPTFALGPSNNWCPAILFMNPERKSSLIFVTACVLLL